MSERHIEAAKDFGGFTEDVQSDEDILLVLRGEADEDPQAWVELLKNPKLPDLARPIVEGELSRLRNRPEPL